MYPVVYGAKGAIVMDPNLENGLARIRNRHIFQDRDTETYHSLSRPSLKLSSMLIFCFCCSTKSKELSLLKVVYLIEIAIFFIIFISFAMLLRHLSPYAFFKVHIKLGDNTYAVSDGMWLVSCFPPFFMRIPSAG